MFTIALVCVFAALFIECLRQRWNTFQLFKRMGIPGPEPSFLWGHYKQLREDHVRWQERWKAEYGQTFGVFWGDKPFLLTCDVEIAKQVLVSQFSSFVNRSNQFPLESAHPVAKHMMTLQKDQRWKQNRMLLSPAFSTGKIRSMTPLIEKSVEELENNVKKNASGEEFDVYPLLKRFSLDNISRIIFGIETNVQRNPEITSTLLKNALQFIEQNLTGSIDLMSNCFMWTNTILGPLISLLLSAKIIPHGINGLIEEMNAIVEARRNAPPRNDLMQSLLDRQETSSEESALTASDSAEGQRITSAKTSSTALTNEEVTASAIIMFAAGYETTSTALAFILNCLGLHPEIQERLRQEIADATRDKPLCYETAMTLPYLDAVIREALRLHPPVTNFITRSASVDTEINGLRIPAGMNILFPAKLIHSDEELWESPTVFDPDRFFEKNSNSLAYLAFGAGPRNCIGMRFAYATIKLLMCRLLSKFEITATEKPVCRNVSVITQPVQLNISVKEISV